MGLCPLALCSENKDVCPVPLPEDTRASPQQEDQTLTGKTASQDTDDGEQKQPEPSLGVDWEDVR